MTVLIGCVGIIAVALFIIALSALIRGFVISVMWGWFIVPVFGLPELSIVQAIGVAMVISLFQVRHYTHTPSGDEDAKRGARNFVLMDHFTNPFVALFVAWIFQMVFM